MSVTRMTSLTSPPEVTVCRILTESDVTQFQETQVLYPAKHMIVSYTRVNRHPLGQSRDRSTCHETHKLPCSHTHGHMYTRRVHPCWKRNCGAEEHNCVLVCTGERLCRVCSSAPLLGSAVSQRRLINSVCCKRLSLHHPLVFCASLTGPGNRTASWKVVGGR